MLRVKDLAVEAARLYMVEPEHVIGESRFIQHKRARDAVIYVARLFGRTLNEIARPLGGRHHTTILIAWRKAVARLTVEPEFDYVVGQLIEWANSRVGATHRQPNPHRKERPHRPVKRVAKVKEGRVTRVVALPAAPNVDEIIAERMKSMERWLTEV
jgi:hypothetical protein